MNLRTLRSAPRPGRTGAPKDAFDRRLLAPMMLGAILNPVNSAILAVSLVPIGAAFGAAPAATAWLVSALYLAPRSASPSSAGSSTCTGRAG